MLITFDKREEDAERRLAMFIAQLVREGIKFHVRSDGVSYEVTLTGGY